MKITDSLICEHFETKPENIEYIVKDSVTRVYLDKPITLSSSFYPNAKLVLEFNYHASNAYIEYKAPYKNTIDKLFLISICHGYGSDIIAKITPETRIKSLKLGLEDLAKSLTASFKFKNNVENETIN